MRRLFALAFFGGCLLSVPREGQAQTVTRHVKASLVAEMGSVRPGRPLTVGVRLEMEPGWHTYWRNPGDSGLPTRVKWTLPEGFQAAELLWPYPVRFGESVVSYGYEHEVLLPAEIQVPRSISAHEVRIGARVDWLECQQACLPGKADLTLTLPVEPRATPSAHAAAFADARRRLPGKGDSWHPSATLEGEEIVLTIRPPRRGPLQEAYLFPLTPRLIDYAKPQVLRPAKGGYTLTLPRDPNGPVPGRVSGVLVAKTEGREQAVQFDAMMVSSTPKR